MKQEMKQRRKNRTIKSAILLLLVLAISNMIPSLVYAFEGICGYEGGISSGDSLGKTVYDYREVCFISGESVVLKGTMTVKKTQKQDVISATYTYVLKNLDKAATLTRTVVYETTQTKKDNGQIIEATVITGKPIENIKVGDKTFILKSFDFSRSSLIDPKPAVNYYAGNIWGKKVFQIGTGTTGSGNITMEINGSFYGYDQSWGTSESMVYDYFIQSEEKKKDTVESWGGIAKVSLSTSASNKLIYQENQPEEISFSGGFVKKQNNNCILEYSASLPEFDTTGLATDKIIESSDSLKIETFPVQTRLLSPDLKQLRGHWSENDVKSLYSLEVLSGDPASFVPEEYMTRAEFAYAMLGAAKEVPKDYLLPKSTTQAKPAAGATKTPTSKVTQPVSPFMDVSSDNPFIKEIIGAYSRGFIVGVGENRFEPDKHLIVADAIATIIRSLGLLGMAPNPSAVTTFKDNDEIPEYARNAAYVAQRIGIIKGDDRGYLRPMEKLTKARAAALINRFIDYMNEGMKKDYRDRVVNYN